MPRIRITVDGRQALTTDQLAALYGIQPGSMRMRLHRHGVRPAAKINPQTPLYIPATVVKKLGPPKGEEA